MPVANQKLRPNRSQVSRKESRKLERLERKKRKADFFSASQKARKRGADEDISDPQRAKKIKIADSTLVEPPQTITRRLEKSKPSLQAEPAKRIPTEERSAPVPKRTSQVDDDEDTYITYLESKLAYKGGRKIKRKSEVDGLDDLLDFASSIIPSSQHDKAGIRKRSSPTPIRPPEDIVEEPSDASESRHSDSGTEDEGDFEEPSKHQSASSSSASHADASSKPAAGSPYVPPHLRDAAQGDVGKQPIENIKLQRQLKGLLNRVSEQNMVTILNSIEEAYRDHRRHDVTSTLTTLIIDGIASHSSLLDSYVVLYAALISSLHRLVGVELAAYFTQNVVATYERYYNALGGEERSQGDTGAQGKECSNLIVLISELYNFQVISCILVYDIIRGLLDKEITEFNVELLLKIVRNSGQQLRQDDPTALKDIIQIVQTKLSGREDSISSRTRFMVETLINLKNNKFKKNISQNQGGDAVERMKKFLSGLGKKRHVFAHEPLRVSLEDFHSAEGKGKWWLIGSAWGGDPLLDRGENAVQLKDDAGDDADGGALKKLARKQGMNTDIRRSIFVVLMSSDDYVDACDRLAQLNLTEVQQREIIRVLLHCCGNEKSYNPFYTLVGQQLCKTSHSYKITLQFCLWDFLREMGENSVGGMEVIKNVKDDHRSSSQKVSASRMNNVAKAYAWWIAKDCSSLTILKAVDFTLLQPQTSQFLTTFFVQLFTSSQTTNPAMETNPRNFPSARDRQAVDQIFNKATKSETLAIGIIYFLSKKFQNAQGSELVKWASEVAMETLRTA